MKFDPAKLTGEAAWEVYEITPDFRRSRVEIEPGKFIVRTEFFADEILIANNQQEFNDSDGKRWGEGQVVARIPLNKLYQDVIPHIRDGDKEHLKWWLNRDEAKPFRTFKGRV